MLNDFVGDTWIAATLSVRAVEWYKALVPMPYVVMMAIYPRAAHDGAATGSRRPCWRRCCGRPRRCWSSFLYARVTYEEGAEAFLDRLGFWWGAPYPLLVLVLFAAPLLAGWALSKRR